MHGPQGVSAWIFRIQMMHIRIVLPNLNHFQVHFKTLGIYGIDGIRYELKTITNRGVVLGCTVTPPGAEKHFQAWKQKNIENSHGDNGEFAN